MGAHLHVPEQHLGCYSVSMVTFRLDIFSDMDPQNGVHNNCNGDNQSLSMETARACWFYIKFTMETTVSAILEHVTEHPMQFQQSKAVLLLSHLD